MISSNNTVIVDVVKKHSDELIVLTVTLNELIKDHQRLAGNNTHELTNGYQLYIRAITAVQKTLLSLDAIRKELPTIQQS